MTLIRMLSGVIIALIAGFGAVAATPDAKVDTRSPGEIVAAAAKTEWVAIAPFDLLVMDLAADRDGKARRVVIQLMSPPFSQGWISNIRKLVAAHFWDGTSINRVQDNYVVQWGDANAEDKAKAKVLPSGLAKVPQTEYVQKDVVSDPNEIVITEGNHRFLDPYLRFGSPGFKGGWPFGTNGRHSWPVHCYGMVGVGRDMPPDTGTGAELYTVIGHAPRHLDRNIALVGRVIEGIEHLSSLPRGTGALGFYETASERVPIVSVRIGSDIVDLPRFEYLNTDGETFANYADARANRRDAFFIQPAGGADICNIPVPIRRAKSR